MEKIGNVTLFPYDAGFVDALRMTNLRTKYEQVFLCTMKGWGYSGLNAGKVDNGECIKGLTISDTFEECVNKSGTVIFLDSDNEVLKGKFIYPKMFDVAMRAKNIIDLLSNNEMKEEVERLCAYNNCQYSSFSWEDRKISTNDLSKELGLVDTDVPVVVVLGETENTKKYLVERSLKNHIEESGYKVELIGSKSFSGFIGDISFPKFIISDKTTGINQILLFNKFIKEIEIERKPDVIIVGVPGGFLPINSRLYGDFGLLANKVLKAIVPDFLIVNVLFEKYYPNFFDELQGILKGKFSSTADAFCVSNYHIDWEKVEQVQPQRIPFLNFSKETISEDMEICRGYTDIPVYNTMSEEELETLSKQVIQKLTQENEKMIFERY